MAKSAVLLLVVLSVAARPASVEIRFGTDPVCEVVRQEVARDWPVLRGTARSTQLSSIEWRDSEAAESLPSELGGAQESQFDFDNDGTCDRVFARSFEDHYMQGSVLLVQRGPKLDDPWFLPCQLNAKPIRFEECPPFTQQHDEAGFSMQGATAKEKVFFRGRYSDLTPFRFSGTTFVAVESHAENARSYVGVIKPMPGKQFQQTCVLHITRKR
jgi:hypothetical protein